MSDSQHWLVVTQVNRDGNDMEFGEYEIEHPGCELDEDGMHKCAVAWQEYNGGVRFSLKYSGTPVTEPGRYPLVAWNDVYRGFDYTEYDGGLAIAIEGEQVGAAAAVSTERCHAGSDGDCFWPKCPQEANGRANYQSHCPLDVVSTQ